MLIIDTPFVKEEDNELCALLKSDENKFAPVPDVVEEIWKVLNLMPMVKQRIALRLMKDGMLA